MDRVLALKVEDMDTVATIFAENIAAGSKISVVDLSGKQVEEIQVSHDIHYGHKIALKDMEKGEDVFKYGICIGFTSCQIKKGELIHVHNLESKRGRGDLVKREKEKCQ